MCPLQSLGLSGSVTEQWFLQDYETLGLHTVSDYRQTSCIGPWLLSNWPWSLRPLQNYLMLPWSSKLMTCMLGSWNYCLVLHFLGNCFVLHNRLGLLPEFRCLYLNLSWFSDLRWLLRHLPCRFFPWLVGSFLFLESLCFPFKECWTHNFILVCVGYNPAHL